MNILEFIGLLAVCGAAALALLLWICARCKSGKPKPHQLLDPLYLVPLLLLVLPCRAAAPPNKPIYVTNYVYSYFNQTNWIYNNTVTTQTNYVYSTNYVHTTNIVYNIMTVTNVLWVTNTWAPPPPNLTLTNLSVSGWFFMSNSTPGLIQTFNGSNITGHLP